MKDLSKYIPGFRSNNKWKKIMASIFYIMIILVALVGGLEATLAFGGLGLFVFSIAKLINNKRLKESLKTPAILLIVAMILIGSGININSNNAIAAEEAESMKLAQEENKQLITENTDLIKTNENLKSENKQLQEVNDEFIAKEEEVKKQEEAKLAEEQEKEKIKEEEAKKQEEAKKVEEEKQAKEALIAKSNEKAKSNSGSGSNKTAPSSTPAPAKIAKTPVAPAENTAEVLVTPTGKKYHKRKCGNGNYSPSTLANAKARGLTPCKKCF